MCIQFNAIHLHHKIVTATGLHSDGFLCVAYTLYILYSAISNLLLFFFRCCSHSVSILSSICRSVYKFVYTNLDRKAAAFRWHTLTHYSFVHCITVYILFIYVRIEYRPINKTKSKWTNREKKPIRLYNWS